MRETSTQAMVYLAVYFCLGLIICGIVAVVGRLTGKKDFTPLSFVIGGEPLLFLVSVILWPLWVVVQIVEWRWRDPVRAQVESTERDVPSMIGVAMSDLKPGGKVRIGERTVDAITVSGLIAAGEEIEVVERMPTGVRVKRRSVQR